MVAGRVRAAQIEAVRRYTPWMMAANIAIAIILAVTFQRSAAFDGVLLWSSVVSVAAGYSILHWWQKRHVPAPRSASMRGIRRTVVHTAVLGVAWALLPALFFHQGDENQRLLIACTVAGMLCGSGFALATIPAAATIFSGILAIGSTGALLMYPSVTTMVMLGLNGIYMAVISTSSRSLSMLLSSRLEAQIRSDEQRDFIGLLLNDFEEHGSDWLWMVDRNYRIQHVSSRLSEVLQISEEDLLGKRITECLPLRDNVEFSAGEIDSLRNVLHKMRDRKPFRDMEIPVRIQGVNRIWSLTARPVFQSDGSFEGYSGVGRDVTIASEARQKIEYLAKFDSLTGLPNRISLNDNICRALRRLQRNGDSFALLLLDLDNFKIINDTQGHPVGDVLLRQVAERIQAAVRGLGTVARLGGDEFAIVTNALLGRHQAEAIADRVAKHFSAPFMLGGGKASVGVSIGIAYVTSDADDADTLIRHADLALYRAKDEGRGRWFFFEASLDTAAKRRHQLERDLRQALEHGGLELYYQPLVAAATGEIETFEALIRWNHRTLGILSPVDFIPIAEETGLIGPVGAWAVREACRQALEWPEHVRVAVNLSPAQFQSPGLFIAVQSALAVTGLAPHRLELEVTESLLLDTTGIVQSTLAALTGLNVRIVLDDFGTGYSSLSYLREYRFSKLKIDRSFVLNVESEFESLAIIRAIVRLSRDLNMAVAAEGVETQGQFDSLREVGCEQIQGYLIARPMPHSATKDFIAARRSGEAVRSVA